MNATKIDANTIGFSFNARECAAFASQQGAKWQDVIIDYVETFARRAVERRREAASAEIRDAYADATPEQQAAAKKAVGL